MYWGNVTKNTQIPNGNRDSRITGGGGEYTQIFFVQRDVATRMGKYTLGGGGELTMMCAPNA